MRRFVDGVTIDYVQSVNNKDPLSHEWVEDCNSTSGGASRGSNPQPLVPQTSALPIELEAPYTE